MTRSVALIALLACAGTAAAGNKYYMRSQNGDAWGQNGERLAMDVAFGPGGWIDQPYETANLGQVFSANTEFVFIDGGDGNGTSFKTFVEGNIGTLENWVANGGCLFLNAATWGDSINAGFGGVSIDYGSGCNFRGVDPNHYIFTGPAQPTQKDIDGSCAVHNRINGPGLTVIANTEVGDVSLASKLWGNGHVMFGGLTDPNFWYGNVNAAINVRANMFTYCPAIPAPGAAALLGVAGLAATRRRR